MIDENVIPPRVKVCNCAYCGCLLIGQSMRKWYKNQSSERRRSLPPLMACRVGGRPYCSTCSSPKYPPAGRSGPVEDNNPWGDNALKDFENRFDGME